mmetsp:Transcript_50197/g.145566  ORF Transcript_50197/g.145566 Transcript_50197/m.145566 type:complete len:286 (-) Transcript_50197:86-943(-)
MSSTFQVEPRAMPQGVTTLQGPDQLGPRAPNGPSVKRMGGMPARGTPWLCQKSFPQIKPTNSDGIRVWMTRSASCDKNGSMSSSPGSSLASLGSGQAVLHLDGCCPNRITWLVAADMETGDALGSTCLASLAGAGVQRSCAVCAEVGVIGSESEHQDEASDEHVSVLGSRGAGQSSPCSDGAARPAVRQVKQDLQDSAPVTEDSPPAECQHEDPFSSARAASLSPSGFPGKASDPSAPFAPLELARGASPESPAGSSAALLPASFPAGSFLASRTSKSKKNTSIP